MFEVIPFVVLAGAIPLFIALYYKDQRDRKRLLGRDRAAALGGTYFEESDEIGATLDGVALTIRSYVGKAGEEVTVRASQLPHWVSIKLRPESHLGKLAEIVGLHELKIGDLELDQTYRITANDEDIARAWLSQDVRRLLTNAADYEFHLSDGEVTARTHTHAAEQKFNALKQAARAVAALARGHHRLMAEWRQLAGSFGVALNPEASTWEPGSATAFDVDEGSVRARIEAVRTSLPTLARTSYQTSTRVSVERTHDREEFTISREDADEAAGAPLDLTAMAPYQVHSCAPQVTAPRLGGELGKRLVALAPRRVHGGASELAIDLPGVVLDAARVRQAVELAVAVAGPVVASASVGPYR